MDEDILSDSLVGEGRFQANLLIENQDETWIELLFRGKTAVELLIQTMFKREKCEEAWKDSILIQR